jgi:oligopeptide transport system permease protein
MKNSLERIQLMKVARVVWRRLLWAIPTLLTLVTVTFLLLRAAPGGPYDHERAVSPQVEANLRAAYDLDSHWFDQYLRYLGLLLKGDLGPSLKFKDYSVAELIAATAPISLLLGALAILLALAVGLWLGPRAAMAPGGRLDRTLSLAAALSIALPSFVLAPFLALIFGFWIGWLPVAGWGDGRIAYVILPVATLALPLAAICAHLSRTATTEALSAPHVRTAKAKGLPPAWIMGRHVLPLALVPVLSWLGPAAAALMAGSVVVEVMYGIPGLGRSFAQAALNRDYTLVMGTVLLAGGATLICNLFVDVACAVLDPRIDEGTKW